MKNVIFADSLNDYISQCIATIAEEEDTINFVLYTDSAENWKAEIFIDDVPRGTITNIISSETNYVLIPVEYYPTTESVMTVSFTNDSDNNADFIFNFPNKTDGIMSVAKDSNFNYTVKYTLQIQDIDDVVTEIVDINTNIDDINTNIDTITADVDDISTEVETLQEELPTIIEDRVVTNDIMNAVSCFSKFMFVQYLETNFEALDIHQTYVSKRNYIRIFDNTVEVIEANINATEQVNYTDPDGNTIYWTSISGVDAYKYFTYTSPLISAKAERPSGITDEQFEEMYKVKVRKTDTEYIKAKLGFPDLVGTGEPELTFGVGNQQGYGILTVRKTTEQSEIIYTSTTQEGKELGIAIKDDGLYQIRGFDENKIPFFFVDSIEPVEAEEGDIWFKLP